MSVDDLRELVAEANVAVARAGLVVLSFGNVSGVDRDAGILAIKPSGMRCGDVRPADIVLVALDDGRVVDPNGLRPSSDTPTHRHLYRDFPEVGGVVHTHSTSAAAWAQAGHPIPALGTTHADTFRGPVPVSRELTPAEVDGEYEWETGAVIVETLQVAGRTATDSPGVLVRSHGPFAWANAPAAAVENAILLEEIATVAFRTLVIDPSTSVIPDELLRRHFDRKHGAAAYYGQPGWPSGKR